MPRFPKVAVEAFYLTLPAFFSFFPISFLFGVLFTDLPFNWYWAPIMSIFAYVGAAQFATLGLMADNAPLTKIAFTAIIINFRFIFYGINFLKRYRTVWWKKFYLIFGLTDITYSLLAIAPPNEENDLNFCLWATLFPHSYWIAGTIVGALIGSYIPPIPGSEFSLVALFIVMGIEQGYKVKEMKPFLITAIAAVIAFWLAPQYFLVTAIILCTVGLFI